MRAVDVVRRFADCSPEGRAAQTRVHMAVRAGSAIAHGRLGPGGVGMRALRGLLPVLHERRRSWISSRRGRIDGQVYFAHDVPFGYS